MSDLTANIRGCIASDHKRQKMVYERYRGYSLKIVFRYIYDYDKAVDVVNDGFVKLFRTFKNFVEGNDERENEMKLMGLIKRIMVNTSIDQLRKSKDVSEMGMIPEGIWDIPDNSTAADNALLHKDLIILIKQLPANYRTIFNLYVIDGYSHSEIAEMLNIPEGTSKSSLSRARQLLKEGLDKLNINARTR
jgi:RNA polymerase sigma factor (sigma-70 family)